MKRSTKSTDRKPRRLLDPSMAKLILRTHLLSLEIAHQGNFSQSYVSQVVKGKRPPSDRFFSALSRAVDIVINGMAARAIKAQIAESR